MLEIASSQNFIYELVSGYTKQYFSGLEIEDKREADLGLVRKVEREISRIKLQSGIEQANVALGTDYTSTHKPRLSRYLTADFVQRLAYSVVDNELITDKFPIHIKYIQVERVRPLPLYIRKGEEKKKFALNSFLIDENEQEAEGVQGLARQVAYRVKIDFYIKTPKDYEKKFEKVSAFSHVSGKDRLEFSEEIVGIGCITSHITTLLNRLIFWHIPFFEEYLPIINGIHCNDEVMGGTPNSPVWSNCTVRMYKDKDIHKAIAQDLPRDEIATAAEIADADFCGFDLIETSAKAALHARLKLVKQVLAKQPGTTADGYITVLCNKIEELTAFKRAQQFLSHYPFSLRAMEGDLETTIFKDNYRKRTRKFQFEICVDEETGEEELWSSTALAAQIEIAEANLKEGLSHIAKQYLEIIRPYFEGEEKIQISSLLKARYYLCWFRYYYLGDIKHQKDEFPDRYRAVRQAEESLECASRHLKTRLIRYDKLNELTQSNVHPHFYLLSRIYAHKAKLYIFFPSYMRKLSQTEMLLEPVKLLEKARIYAARDGDPALYAQWSAYQSWCYVMIAYINRKEDVALSNFSYGECFEWAEQLLSHAEICYSATGRDCYQQIKDRGGSTTEYVHTEPSEGDSKLATRKYYERYGKTVIEVIPLIKELFLKEDEDSSVEKQGYEETSNVITLDFSLLKKRKNDEKSSIYLFGMQSGIILFAQGMLSLCKPYKDDRALIEAVETRAMRLFNYCCAIASDGTRRKNKNASSTLFEKIDPESIVLDRDFIDRTEESESSFSGSSRFKDRLLQRLYPHRLTQFSDLGKIFIIVCEILLLVTSPPIKDFYKSKQNTLKMGTEIQRYTNEIRRHLKALRINEPFPFPEDERCGQQRYNGHLAEHYVQIEHYVEDFIAALQRKKIADISGLAIRDLIVTDIFKMIRGTTNPSAW